MKLTIIPSDGIVGVDGVFRKVSMSGIDPAIHAVQFDDATGRGHVEHKARGSAERALVSRSEFQVFVDRWTAAAPPPPPPPPPPPDLSDSRNLGRQEQAIISAMAVLSGKTESEARAAYANAFRALP